MAVRPVRQTADAKPLSADRLVEHRRAAKLRKLQHVAKTTRLQPWRQNTSVLGVLKFSPDVDLVHSSRLNEALDDLVERGKLTDDRPRDAVVAVFVPWRWTRAFGLEARQTRHHLYQA